jgi:hypothetical protein
MGGARSLGLHGRGNTEGSEPPSCPQPGSRLQVPTSAAR